MSVPAEKPAAGKNELKLAVVGAGAVGKTAMTIRFVTSHFYDQGYNPTIEDSYRKQLVVNGEAFTLEVLDTAGQEEYAAMADQWYRYAQGFLLVYSLTDRQSLFALQKMHQDILRVKQKDARDVPCLVCDLAEEREVGQLEARDLARSFHSPFIECSAADGVNVDAAFRELVKLVRRKKRREDKRMAIAHERILAGPLAGVAQPAGTAGLMPTPVSRHGEQGHGWEANTPKGELEGEGAGGRAPRSPGSARGVDKEGRCCVVM